MDLIDVLTPTNHSQNKALRAHIYKTCGKKIVLGLCLLDLLRNINPGFQIALGQSNCAKYCKPVVFEFLQINKQQTNSWNNYILLYGGDCLIIEKRPLLVKSFRLHSERETAVAEKVPLTFYRNPLSVREFGTSATRHHLFHKGGIFVTSYLQFHTSPPRPLFLKKKKDAL